MIGDAVNDDALIAAWHTERTLREIADEFGVSQSLVEREWRRLKFYGRLPETKRNIKRLPVGGPHEPEFGLDLPPLYSDDPLLDRLRAVHGPDGRPDLVRRRNGKSVCRQAKWTRSSL